MNDPDRRVAGRNAVDGTGAGGASADAASDLRLDLSAAAYERIRGRIAAWAAPEPTVRSVVLVGSRARVDHPADEWADLDVILFVTEPRRWLVSGDWLAAIGPVWFRTRHATSGNLPEWLVTFAGGADVDFVIHPVQGGAAASREPHGEPSGQEAAAGMFARGMTILLDKDGAAAGLRAAMHAPAAAAPPSAAELAELCESFWCVADRVARKIGRGEIHVALLWLTEIHARLVLQLLEWHARASHAGPYDTWHAGRFLEEWVDPRIRSALALALPGYDREALARGLVATVELFEWVAAETAARLGHPFPSEKAGQARALIRALLTLAGFPSSDGSSP